MEKHYFIRAIVKDPLLRAGGSAEVTSDSKHSNHSAPQELAVCVLRLLEVCGGRIRSYCISVNSLARTTQLSTARAGSSDAPVKNNRSVRY